MSARKVVRLWDVEGVPVVETVRGCFVAVDSDAPRRFPGDSVLRNGGEVSEERFAELFPEAVLRIAAALATPLPSENSSASSMSTSKPSTTPADSATTSTKRSSNPTPPPLSEMLPPNFDQMYCEALSRGIEKGIETP